ncbi:right-handed parallel beta-helix repeat-containing protein [Pedobacter panaciterrae]|uniref:right-handed parallel beta-helix repeat-containing protein n=1 Tax=Pedobacter panaciterrae TaxID=363849 RepID=UPI0025929E46|nr:right-handed parallel beta-helix repeat-containing protein [uncultured Pedobacter sp.]
MKAKLIILVSFFICTHKCFAQVADLTMYLPKSHVVDGSVDYTEYIQRGLEKNKEVSFPNFPVLINENGLNVRDNQTMNFLKNSKLIMRPNSNEKYGLLNLVHVSNVTINNPNLEGDRARHKGTKGEWGMGINILSSSKVSVHNPRISNFWGDGIYIGEIPYADRKKYNLDDYSSKDIAISGGVINNNRRNGISIVSVKGLLVENTLIQNTKGALPMAGIDIEPNNNEQFLEDILIKGVTTKNNAEIGIKYVSSRFVGKRNKRVAITIEDCKDQGSKTGLFLGGLKSSYSSDIRKLDGNISIKNYKSYSNEYPLRSGSNHGYNPGINLQSFSIYKNEKRDSDKEKKLVSEARTKKISIN